MNKDLLVSYFGTCSGDRSEGYQRQATTTLASLSQQSSSGWTWLFKISAGKRTDDRALVSEEGDGYRTSKMARLEAVLFVSDSAVSSRRLAQLATLADAAEARDLIEQLNEMYDSVDCAFRIERVATGYQILTRPEFVFWLDKLHQRQTRLKLSVPAIETLTIVAHRQPVTRADIEAVRGVQSSEMLKQLMERGLVRIVGEDDSLGRPYLYGTTSKFLELFGLKDLDELPMAEMLRHSKAENSHTAKNVATSDVNDENLESAA